MQFTVLIEFLIPGLLTTIFFLLILFDGQLPQLPKNMPGGESATVLLLLAVSYPVGILVNFPVFKWLQGLVIVPRVRLRILEQFRQQGVDLVKVAGHRFSISFQSETSDELSQLWRSMSASAFSCGVDRLSSNTLYHEGLQRFARGMLLPLLFAVVLVARHCSANSSLLTVILGSFFALSVWLLQHSLYTEYEQIARFFLSEPSMGPAIKAATIKPGGGGAFTRVSHREGEPHVRTLPISVATVIGRLSEGESWADLLEELPELEPEDISECLRYAASLASSAGTGGSRSSGPEGA